MKAIKEKEVFCSISEFKKQLLSNSKLSVEEFSETLRLYIEAVKYSHFTRQLKGEKYDEDIDIKLTGVYELINSLNTIIKEQSK